MPPADTSDTAAPADALDLVRAEVDQALRAVIETSPDGLEAVAGLLADADRVFVHGAGRSGLALRMTAMRLMHFGLTVHVVGDVTTPAIREGDVLLTASGSGTTGGIVRAAEAATEAGARVAAVTTASSSPLAELATAVVIVPAAEKLDRSGDASAQYAGGLFEQVVVLVGDAIFHSLWKRSGIDADDLWPRHANLE
ncbi:6-phospho-3-hexuloisomerase [Frigoribacterium sp. CFBP 13712]|uniref:6-phospho-3-hexuloisomerase n=1 Tax=Frigoribacterium sp. CFBP 13712 TaxID=2775309 RepID=UPI00177BCF8D|nr:6-phospho-3-hexuloisomerase [Frigoribacterium sp. CFBP 13712]MBD8704057.1 6-phospho-3-hexuloisomerase [Frigoribacterium sp. CFBP 13712]